MKCRLSDNPELYHTSYTYTCFIITYLQGSCKMKILCSCTGHSILYHFVLLCQR